MKINLLLISLFISILLYASIDEEHGIVGLTKRDGGTGCICHNFSPTDSVIVWIEGPDSVNVGDSVNYKLLMTGGPAVGGGFNIASYIGVLDSTDTLTHVIEGQLTHTSPNLFFNDTVKWNFLYVAPDSTITDTIYSVGNSVNLDGMPTNLDQWNFGENFIIHVIDRPVTVKNESPNPKEFVLYQNYPNPFNPMTTISWRSTVSSWQSLKVYDLIGNIVATLVDEYKPAGRYEVEFDAASLPSGIYFYRLEIDRHSFTRKMIILK
jgi:hypothetical protein